MNTHVLTEVLCLLPRQAQLGLRMVNTTFCDAVEVGCTARAVERIVDEWICAMWSLPEPEYFGDESVEDTARFLRASLACKRISADALLSECEHSLTRLLSFGNCCRSDDYIDRPKPLDRSHDTVTFIMSAQHLSNLVYDAVAALFERCCGAVCVHTKELFIVAIPALRPATPEAAWSNRSRLTVASEPSQNTGRRAVTVMLHGSVPPNVVRPWEAEFLCSPVTLHDPALVITPALDDAGAVVNEVPTLCLTMPDMHEITTTSLCAAIRDSRLNLAGVRNVLHDGVAAFIKYQPRVVDCRVSSHVPAFPSSRAGAGSPLVLLPSLLVPVCIIGKKALAGARDAQLRELECCAAQKIHLGERSLFQCQLDHGGTLHFPSGVTTIGDFALVKAIVTSADLSACNQLATLGDGFFAASTLSSVALPATSSLTAIGTSFLRNCTNLVVVDLGCLSVTSIGQFAFAGCIALKSFTLPASLTKLDDHAFDGCRLISSFCIASMCPELTHLGGFVCSGASSLVEVKLPDTLSCLGEGAFERCIRLAKVDLSNTQVTHLASRSFRHCERLTELVLPRSLASVHERALHNSGLKTVDLRHTNVRQPIRFADNDVRALQ